MDLSFIFIDPEKFC